MEQPKTYLIISPQSTYLHFGLYPYEVPAKYIYVKHEDGNYYRVEDPEVVRQGLAGAVDYFETAVIEDLTEYGADCLEILVECAKEKLGEIK